MPDAERQLDVSRIGGVTVAALRCRNPYEREVEQIHAEFRELLAAPEARDVVLDFAGVAHFGADLRGRLVWLSRELAARGGRLALAGLGGMRAHLAALRFDMLMILADDPPGALAALGDRGDWPTAFARRLSVETARDRYRRAFPARHAVLPVVHVQSPEQAAQNARIARDAGADGVFLINHEMSDYALLDIHAAVANEHPGWWVGVNCLGLPPEDAFEVVSPKVAGLWADNAGIDEANAEQPYAERVAAVRRGRAPGCLYFGGVAFKYQRPVADLEAACRIAARYVDVATTSGPGTGHAADVEKIRRMRAALGDTPLALASGVTPENVADYLPVADCFLVATGIGRNFHALDPARARLLVERVRAFAG